MRILVVEDEESLRITLAANLELEGYEVVEACNGKEAIDLLDNGKFDLVLSDIRMPRATGVDVLLHAKEHHPGVPVVLMTAYAMEDQVRTAMSEGVFAVLKKPFDFSAAAAAIVRALRHPLVLVVDDDAALASTLVESLRAAGVRAQAADGGEAAVAAVNSGQVDVCVADLVMPGINGIDLVHHIQRVAPDITVIVFSGENIHEMIRLAAATGIFAYMSKPIDPNELLHAVAKARGGSWTH
jgi:DNA-binding NtrC family response regulator